jgi:methionyl-tRNA synthetase
VDLSIVASYEANYPNSAFHTFMVNVPRSFDAIFQLMQPIMSESTKKAIKLFGYDKEEWGRELLKEIAEDQLLPAFGGTKH